MVNKVTPTDTVDWYIKWIASGFGLLAVVCRSVEEIPNNLDLYFSFIGTLGWAYVGFLWHDRAIMILNGILLFFLTTGILRLWL